MKDEALNISIKTGVPKFEVYRIWSTQFKIVADTMKKGEFNGVMLPYLGKFVVSPTRFKVINEAAARKRQIENGIIQRREPHYNSKS